MQRIALVLPITYLFIISINACSSSATNQSSPTVPSTPTVISQQSSPQSGSSSMTYQPNSGPHTVEVADNLSLTTKTGRKMPLKVYYPQGQGPFPTIIFSHGGGGSKDFYGALGRYWASYGYVSIHPTHSDSISIRGREFMKELGDYALKNSKAWQERASDISLVIDSFSNLEQQAPQLQGKVDAQRVGVGGHSFGAYTAQLVGGATIDIPNGPKSKSFVDKRVKALLLLSPQGIGQQGLTASSWKNMTLPSLFMTGTNDKLFDGKGPEWRREGFDAVPGGDKYLIFIEGASHFSFSGRLAEGNGANNRFGGRNQGSIPQAQQGSPGGLRGRIRNRIRERIKERVMERQMGVKSDPNVDQKAIFGYVQMGSLAFWDAYLKDNSAAKEYLTQKRLETVSGGEAVVTVR